MQRARPATALIFAITATGIMGNPLIAPVIPDILADLEAPRAAAGWVIGAATMPGIVLAPLIGALADRYGRRLVLTPCLTVFGLGGLLAATATSIEALVVFRLLQGLGSAGLVNLAVVLIGDNWSGTDRAAMVGRNAAVLTVCLTVFPLAGGAIADLAGWRWSFAPFGLALVTAGTIWRRLPRERPSGDVAVLAQITQALPGLRTARSVAVMLSGFLVFALIFGMMLTVMPVYLESTFGLSATLRGLVLGAPALASTAVALSLGRVRGRWGYRTVVLAGCAALALGLLGMSAAATVVALFAVALVFGLGEGLVVPTLQERAASAGPEGSRATSVAAFVSISRLGQTVGPVGAAWVAASPGGPPLAFAAGAGVAVAMAVVFAALTRHPAEGTT